MGRDFRKLQGPYSTVWDKLHLGTWPGLCVCVYVCVAGGGYSGQGVRGAAAAASLVFLALRMS